MQSIMHIYVLNDTLNMSCKILIASKINWRVFWALAFLIFLFLFLEKLLMFHLMSFYLKVDPKF